MTTDTHRLLIGSAGWQHLDWQDSYYPEDLPVDWRLGYYANEFSLAVITNLEQELSEDLFAEIEECSDRQSFIVALTLDASVADPVQALQDAVTFAQRLEQHCAGILLQFNPTSFAEPQAVLTLLKDFPASIPLSIDALDQPLSATLREQLRERGIGWSWNAVSDSDGLDVGRLGVIVIEGELPTRELRDRVETALKFSTDQRRLALIFAGQPPSVEQMRQAKMIEELL